MILDTVISLPFVFSGTVLIFDIQDVTYRHCDASQSAKTNQEVKTAESSEIVYSSVHFTSRR